MSDFSILGHRGAILPNGPFYQNSLQAFAEALAVCDGFETDACASRDGDVFLIHEAKYVNSDSGVDYCAAEHLAPDSARLLGTRRLEEVDSATLRQLRLKDGSPIPELPQVLDMVAQSGSGVIDIELKGHAVLQPVLRALAASRVRAEQVVLSSFCHPALLEARKLAPHYRIGALCVSTDTVPAPLFPWHPGSEGRYLPFNDTTLSQPLLTAISPDYIIIPDNELTMEAAVLVERYVPSAQIMAWVFTERGGVGADALAQIVSNLNPTGKLAALILDNPRATAAKLRAAARV